MKQLSNNEACPDCGRYANRGISVDAVIIQEGKLLLCQRGVEPFKGYWGICGGYVGWDETVEEACKREVKEETHLDVVSLKLINVYSNPTRHPKQTITVAFAVEVRGDAKPGDDIQALKWVEPNPLPADLPFDHEQILTDYFNQ